MVNVSLQASKRLNTTQSTTYMLKSEQSFNRMTESSASVNEDALLRPAGAQSGRPPLSQQKQEAGKRKN